MTKDLNLTTLFGAAVNLPSVTENIDGKPTSSPLYPRGVNSKASAGTHGEEWARKSNSTYNSPRNARIVCLGRNGAHVGYWAPPIIGGNPKSGFQFAPYTVAKKPVTLRAGNFSAKDAGLKAITQPYILGNIEELWITADAFMCPNAHPAYGQVYQTAAAIPPGRVVPDTQRLLSSILQSVLPQGKTIADMFPVLRAIVVVNMQPNALDFHRAVMRTDDIRQQLKEFYPSKRGSIGELLTHAGFKHNAITAQFGYFVCVIPTGDVTKFSLGDYKFDELYLAKHKQAVLEKYALKPNGTPPVAVVPKRDEATVEAPAEKSEPVVQQVDESEGSLAEIIKSLEGEFSPKTVKTALFAYKTAHPDYFKQEAPKLPAALQNKYAFLLQDKVVNSND